jgi:hypothetical protein
MNKILLGTGLVTAVILAAPVYAQGQGQGGYGMQGGYYGQGGNGQGSYTQGGYYGQGGNGQGSGGVVQAPGAMPNYPGPGPSGPMSGGGGSGGGGR